MFSVKILKLLSDFISTSQMFHVIFINGIVHRDLFTKETIKICKRTTQIDVPMER